MRSLFRLRLLAPRIIHFDFFSLVRRERSSQVHYAPKVALQLVNWTRPENTNFNSSVQVKNATVLEGSEVHFRCDADANPSDVNYKWFINDELVVGDYTTEMVIYHLVLQSVKFFRRRTLHTCTRPGRNSNCNFSLLLPPCGANR